MRSRRASTASANSLPSPVRRDSYHAHTASVSPSACGLNTIRSGTRQPSNLERMSAQETADSGFSMCSLHRRSNSTRCASLSRSVSSRSASVRLSHSAMASSARSPAGSFSNSTRGLKGMFRSSHGQHEHRNSYVSPAEYQAASERRAGGEPARRQHSRLIVRGAEPSVRSYARTSIRRLRGDGHVDLSSISLC